MKSEDYSLVDEKGQANQSNSVNTNDTSANTEKGFNSGVIRKTEYFDLFISYKRDNGGDNGQKLAEELYQKLSKEGFRVWLDREEIGFSSNFETRIEEAILHSKKIACVLSPAWVNSPNCRYEYKKALAFEKRIIPIHYKEFRALLCEKKDKGELTEYEWQKLDKPQEVDFSSVEKYTKAYSDLKALCQFNDSFFLQHTQILCESYYWIKYNRPKGMLLKGATLSKAKLLKSKCNSDDELSSFCDMQNEFLNTSGEFVTQEVTSKRKVFIFYTEGKYDYGRELNMELKLNNISTFFDSQTYKDDGEKAFVKQVINCETVIQISDPDFVDEEDVTLSFVRSKNKRILKVTNSKECIEKGKVNNEKNIFFWDSQTSIDDLIASINGDKDYNIAHANLLEEAYKWEYNGKSDSWLLPLKKAKNNQEWYKKAEELGSEPQPSLAMINFVERSIARGEAMRRRRIMMMWTTAIGVVFLIVFMSLTFVLDKKVKVAKGKIKDANEQVVEAQEKKREADIHAEKAKKNAEIIKEEANKSVQLAQQKLISTKNLLKLADVKLKESQQKMEQAHTEADLARRKVEKANAELQFAKEQILIAKKESDSISFITKGKMKSSKAIELMQSRDNEEAAKTANLALSLLVDSISGSGQLQSLYHVFNQILPKESPLSMAYKEEDKEWKEVVTDLSSRSDIGMSFYPPNKEIYTINKKEYNIGCNNDKVDFELINQVVELTNNKNNISALCIDPNCERIAIGYKSGVVEIWSFIHKQRIERFVNHSYRITSVVFGPNGNQVAMASIDGKFSMVNLNENGKRNEKDEMIFVDNGSRVLELYYWNENILITKSWEGISRLWGTNVLMLRNEYIIIDFKNKFFQDEDIVVKR